MKRRFYVFIFIAVSAKWRSVYGKPDLENLCTETGPTPGTKKIVAPVISSTYQFAVNVNGIPAGKTIRGVIYAKVTDKETQQTKWVYSEEVRLTNK